jgi:hypothetical protein
MLALILLVLGIFLRLFIIAPNFSPAIALVLFGGVYLKKQYAYIFPVALMMISDLFLGMHQLIFFTWGSLILVSLIGRWLRYHKAPTTVIGSGVGSAVVFFLITNFGVWLMGYYPQTAEGLLRCYAMAVPFFRSTVTSTIFYSVTFFGLYELAAKRLKETRFASVL